MFEPTDAALDEVSFAIGLAIELFLRSRNPARDHRLDAALAKGFPNPLCVVALERSVSRIGIKFPAVHSREFKLPAPLKRFPAVPHR